MICRSKSKKFLFPLSASEWWRSRHVCSNQNVAHHNPGCNRKSSAAAPARRGCAALTCASPRARSCPTASAAPPPLQAAVASGEGQGSSFSGRATVFVRAKIVLWLHCFAPLKSETRSCAAPRRACCGQALRRHKRRCVRIRLPELVPAVIVAVPHGASLLQKEKGVENNTPRRLERASAQSAHNIRLAVSAA